MCVQHECMSASSSLGLWIEFHFAVLMEFAMNERFLGKRIEFALQMLEI